MWTFLFYLLGYHKMFLYFIGYFFKNLYENLIISNIYQYKVDDKPRFQIFQN